MVAVTGNSVEGERKTRDCGKRSENLIDIFLMGTRASIATAGTTERKVKEVKSAGRFTGLGLQ